MVAALFWIMAVGSGCATNSSGDSASEAVPGQGSAANAGNDQPLSEELSLKADRTHLNELRGGVPEDIRRKNDELALILQDMAGGDQPPERIRSRFNRSLRLHREKGNQQFRQEREIYTGEEKRKRAAFLNELKKDRDGFLAGKRDASERKRFFDDQDMKRRTYFAAERERRNEFEAKIIQRRRELEDHAREQSNRFNQELRAYRRTYMERRKAEAQKKRLKQGRRNVRTAPAVSDQDELLLQEMNRPPKGRLVPLKAE